MGFSSIAFIFFFLPVLLGLYTIGRKVFKSIQVQNIILILASLFFYRWGLASADGFRILLLLLFGNYMLTLLVRKTKAKWAVFLGVMFNVGLLIFYKYPEPIANLLKNGLTKDVIFPLGLSFIVFHAISYVVDTYKDPERVQSELQEGIDLCLYLLFFPKLLQGPIVPFHQMKDKLRSRSFTLDGVSYGMERFLIGLGKKVLLADEIAVILGDIAVSSAIDTQTAWLAVLLFGLQLYFDFSGYSDMAIGLGSCFGFPIAENFNFPYVSTSIGEFWRRWHISLGAWFRNYIYIPLGGNRKGNVYINLLIVFLLTGIWHGNTAVYVLWGLSHGILILIERTPVYRKLPWQSSIGKAVGLLYTNSFVFVGWLCFRLADVHELKAYLKVMLGKTAEYIPFTWQYFLDAKALVLVLGSILGIWIFSRGAVRQKAVHWKQSLWGTGALYLLLLGVFVLCFISILSNSYSPFLYMQY